MEKSNTALRDKRMFTPELMEFYGYKSRATFLKYEQEARIPKRKKFPDGRLGNMLSECLEWAKGAEEAAQ